VGWQPERVGKGKKRKGKRDTKQVKSRLLIGQQTASSGHHRLQRDDVGKTSRAFNSPKEKKKKPALQPLLRPCYFSGGGAASPAVAHVPKRSATARRRARKKEKKKGEEGKEEKDRLAEQAPTTLLNGGCITLSL